MEPSSRQRKLIFVLVVVALAGLGWYLLQPGAHAAGPGSPSPAATPTRPARPARSATPAATPTETPATSAGPDIYRWLPFTQSELADAVTVVREFGKDYGTFSYSQNASAYVAVMRGLITSQLSQVLARGYAVPGVASLRDSQKQISTGSVVINSLRAFSSASLTFVVTITEQITGSRGRSSVGGQYAVTVTGSGGSWQVDDIELASAGDS
jgi:hypothetical protein